MSVLDFHQKNKLRKFFYSRVVLVIVLLVAAYSLYSTWSIYRKMVQSRKDVEQEQSQLLALEAEEQDLNQEIADLKTSQGVEKEIRAKFGVAKPGEDMAVIVDDSSATSTATTTS